jgi:ferrous iron transport protein B
MAGSRHVVAVVGNPNCGKTTLFNALTGSTQQVGNWPGVTVEKKVGAYRFEGQDYDLVDLPGIYMIGGIAKGSEDERVSRDYILSGEPEVVVNILDAYNLERNLYLTAQLLEMRVPLVVAVNMMDLAEKTGIHIDAEALSRALDCPVVPLVASRRRGIDGLRAAIAQACRARRVPAVQPVHAPAVEAGRQALASGLAEAAAGRGVDAGWVALKLLEGDSFAEGLAGGRLDGGIEAHRAAVEAQCGEEADIIIADGRYSFIGRVMAAAVRDHRKASLALTRRIDKVVLNRFLGVPVFLAAMYLMFLFTIKIGGAFVDFFSQGAEALFVDGTGLMLESLGAPDWLATILGVGVGGGIRTVASFVPIIGSLFLFLSFLEDSGYMARAAFVMDRAMRAVGLPGKSFVPLIVGFGCNVPAIMATRTLESRRDRVLTMMMAPFMSCGARLPVYALFAAAFFAENGQNVVFALYLLGIACAVATGLLLKATLLRGEASTFVLELPPYHLPTARTVLMQTWQRLSEFIFRAGQFIVPLVAVLSVLNAVGTDGSFGKAGGKDSVLAAASRALTPVFRPIGLSDDNWPAAVGLFSGIFAKEAVVGTLNALYAQVDGDAADKEEAGGIGAKLAAAAATVPARLSRVAESLGDPLGLDLSFTGSSEAAAAELKVQGGVFGAMVARFDGAAGALAYMVLILLYTPCVASLGAIRQEAGARWVLFSVGWNTLIGYTLSVACYQAATFARHPAGALGWLAACAAVPLAVAAVLWLAARGGRAVPAPAGLGRGP